MALVRQRKAPDLAFSITEDGDVNPMFAEASQDSPLVDALVNGTPSPDLQSSGTASTEEVRVQRLPTWSVHYAEGALVELADEPTKETKSEPVLKVDADVEQIAPLAPQVKPQAAPTSPLLRFTLGLIVGTIGAVVGMVAGPIIAVVGGLFGFTGSFKMPRIEKLFMSDAEVEQFNKPLKQANPTLKSEKSTYDYLAESLGFVDWKERALRKTAQEALEKEARRIELLEKARYNVEPTTMSELGYMPSNLSSRKNS